MLALLASLLVVGQLVPGAPPGSSIEPGVTPRNVLILLLDDLGADNVGVYGLGPDLPPTPNIDALAGQGVRFLHAWSNPVCSPTRATLMTGRYSFRTGIGYTVVEGSPALGLEELSLAELAGFASPDYATAAFGKWHLGNGSVGGTLAPNKAGFDHYAGALRNLHPPEDYFTWRKVTNGSVDTKTGYITSDTVDDAVQWIQAQGDRPWLAYVAFHAVHTPLHAPPAKLHTQDLSGAGDPTVDPRPYFVAMVESLDTEIGRLLAQAEIDLEETHVVLLGDNGTDGAAVVPPFDPAKAKGTAYQGGVHVPLVVAGPRVTAPGSVCEALVNTTDVHATVADLLGLDVVGTLLGQGPLGPSPSAPSASDSVSLLPYLSEPTRSSIRPWIYTETFRFPQLGGPVDTRRAVRSKRFKLILREVEPAPPEMEFYDLAADPFETQDLLLGELLPGQVDALYQLSDLLAELSADAR